MLNWVSKRARVGATAPVPIPCTLSSPVLSLLLNSFYLMKSHVISLWIRCDLTRSQAVIFTVISVRSRCDPTEIAVSKSHEISVRSRLRKGRDYFLGCFLVIKRFYPIFKSLFSSWLPCLLSIFLDIAIGIGKLYKKKLF